MEEVLEKDTCACAEGAECTCGDNCTCGESCSCQSEIDKEKEHMNKLNEAYNKISELEDKLIRQNADMVNYRKRKEEGSKKASGF